MLKGCFQILYKKTVSQFFNLKHIVMASVMLRNHRIDVNDHFLPCRRLHVKIIREQVEKREDINLSDFNRSKTANWLWNN